MVMKPHGHEGFSYSGNQCIPTWTFLTPPASPYPQEVACLGDFPRFLGEFTKAYLKEYLTINIQGS